MQQQAKPALEPDLEALKRTYDALGEKPRESLNQLVAWAETGSLMSMLYVGSAYRYGWGVPVNFLTAEQWFRRAVDGGLMLAVLDLGSLYLERRRYAEAQAVFEAAAARDYAPAIHQLGRMYFYGHGVAKDFGRARTLLERASAEGNIAAKFQLAHLLRTGHFGFGQWLRSILLRFIAYKEVMSLHPKEPYSERFL